MSVRVSLLPISLLAFLLLIHVGAEGYDSNIQHLDLAQRIVYQKRLEVVYWKHRIWPAENKNPKPALQEVMPEYSIQTKVEDYLRKSSALEIYWGRPISAAQLQSEIDRLVRNTKHPEMLRELFSALDNDPYVIAECLARPLLTERFLRSWYVYDNRFHGALRSQVSSELQQIGGSLQSMNLLSGKQDEVEWIRQDQKSAISSLKGNQHQIQIPELEWKKAIRRLDTIFASSIHSSVLPKDSGAFTYLTPETPEVFVDRLPLDAPSALQEDEEAFYVVAVVEKDANRLKLHSVRWEKESLDDWWRKEARQVKPILPARQFDYHIPAPTGISAQCTPDSWTPLYMGAPAERYQHTAVWTGTEMIIWGGNSGGSTNLNTGGRYDPSTDSWTPPTTTGAPSGRTGHTAVWTGNEMIIWGGSAGGSILNTGARYNPSADSWMATTNTGAPSFRADHTAVWTGNEMIIWGGGFGLDTGGRYNPNTNTWISTSTTNAPTARYAHTAIWTGSEMIVWGGYKYVPGTYFNDGGRYNPNTDLWTPMNTTGAPPARRSHTAVWTGGSEMIVWGGNVGSTYLNTGGRYSAATDNWSATNTSGTPSLRTGHTAVWAGSQMVVWGGYDTAWQNPLNTGGQYDPNSNSWTATDITTGPTARFGHTAIWTGSQMIVWGGYGNDLQRTGGRYTSETNTWTATSVNGAPSERTNHTAVWTGNEMVVWGGEFWYFYRNTGGRYYPITDSWSPTSIAGAPTARSGHVAVWTGTEMIIWGGNDGTGGRYNPSSDLWTGTSVSNAPDPRIYPGVVWTGTEMIVWGGGYLNTGGKYSPNTDTWVATSTTGAPIGRAAHTVVWTGNEMIVWGGQAPGYVLLNSGGCYSPTTDTWVATSIAGAPAERVFHVAAWTGTEMLIWGGDFPFPNTGGSYTPLSDSWAATSITGAPNGRSVPTAVWTGSEMIVWGGQTYTYNYQNTGGRYDPFSSTWASTNLIGAPSPRMRHTAVLTNKGMLIWGGEDGTVADSSQGAFYCTCTDAVNLNRRTYSCDDTISITLADSDLAGTGVQDIEIWSTTESTPEMVTLTEHVANPGTFSGAFSTSPGPPVGGDGKISVGNGDMITVRYVNASACGTSNINVDRSASIDCLGPVITNVRATSITNTSAIITWNTNEPADSTVTYGVSTPPGSNLGNTRPVRVHSVLPTDLNSCAKYYFSVASRDPYGNSASDTNGGAYYTFVTQKSDFAFGPDNVEQGSGSWQATGTGSLWHIDTCKVSSPTHSWKAGSPAASCPGQYSDSTDTSLISSAVNVGSGSRLRFKEWYSTEDCCDYMWTQISTDSGATWTTLASHSGSSGGWVSRDYDLASNSGSSVRIRFWFSPDSSVTDEGWYVDDIEVSTLKSCLPPEVSPPGAIQPLLFSNKTTLVWEEAAASGSSSFNLYRGNLSDLITGSYGTCLQFGISSNSATDFTTPSAMSGFFYLVTGKNALGEGPMGNDSKGNPRQNVNSCP